MSIVDREKLYQSLKELQVINGTQLDQVYQTSKKNNSSLIDLLLEKDLVSDEQLGQVIADLISVPLIDLSALPIPLEVLRTIPELVAQKQKIIAFKKDEQGLHLAMADPSNLEMIEFIKKKNGLPVIVHFATESDIGEALLLYRKEVGKAFEEIISENVDQAKSSKGTVSEPPIIKIVDTIVTYAYQNKASDIHIEPQEDKTVIRFRIDGILHDVVGLPEELHDQIVTRVKVMAKLRTDEHQAAQDGKIQFQTEEALDIRVSITPVTEGEKVVMRLLSEKSRQFSLASLGLLEKDLEKVTVAYEKPHGMILATGPTGCGKTTTMYAVLKILNKRSVNIMTIEDPVEYDIEGVNQVQVNPKTNLTFAQGLRSIVRQDPDIILVGEIRDNETAGIAINSAMTGHLVLSTLHTNDAATAVPRLFDMEVEPFLIASSINVIVAQRLVRKICSRCRYSLEIEKGDTSLNLSSNLSKKLFSSKKTARVYRGKGCPSCHRTGYVGRIGIFEVLLVDDQVREAIVARKDAAEIKKIVTKKGMTTMFEDGLEKVRQGITTIEEINRVTKE